MTTLKAAQLITGITAIACVCWGFGTGWFILGMFALIAHLVLDGLIWKLGEDPTATPAPTYACTIEELFALRDEKWKHAPDPRDPASYGIAPYDPSPYKPPVWGSPRDDR